MSDSFDFDKYWGVQLSGMRFDSKEMSIAFDVFWTVGSKSKKTALRFIGVSICELSAEKIFQSEVVELISIEGNRDDGSWRISGELSNYEFRIVCTGISEDTA